MKNLPVRIAVAVCFVLLAFLPRHAFSEDRDREIEWPATTQTSRPWTFWWWMGSAVEKPEITRNLEALARAGLGGVHIIPIYGARGFEDKYLDFLSPRWIEMFAYTRSEADRLGLGVDLTTGTGWPFGGPQVTPARAAKTFRLAPSGSGYAVAVRNTGQKVKRAAPGGAGQVMDYFSREALEEYLVPFDAAFASTAARPRAFYNDSYEVYGADWTDDLLDEFQNRRGYDLRGHLEAIAGRGDPETRARVLCDYRETVSDLLLDDFTRPWTEWAHRQGAVTRNQAHGSPGNLLDLYAAADVPETEAFGASRFPIPGLDYRHSLQSDQARPDPLVMKFASSAAHFYGKPLVSSESCTWLGEHFTVSLAQVKPEIDQLWLGGINHVFFHGTTYSPTYEDWPGWLFYASTNFGPSNPWFRDLPALNAYIARVQAFLQSGAADNDVLLYWPVHDLWSGVYDDDQLAEFGESLGRAFGQLLRGRPREFANTVRDLVSQLYESRQSRVRLFTVHGAQTWLHLTPCGASARKLWERGYSFDYASDRMIGALTWDGDLRSPGGGAYRVIVVPPCRYFPEATMQKLAYLSRLGARVIFLGGVPADAPGFGNLEERRRQLREAAGQLDRASVQVGDDLDSLLAQAGVLRETMVDRGLSFVRRSQPDGHLYFIANLGPRAVDGWAELAAPTGYAIIFDPLRGQAGLARLRTDTTGVRVYLQLEPGQSLALKTFRDVAASGPAWKYFTPAGAPVEVKGTWRVEFVAGGPALPAGYDTDRLGSWTERPGDGYKYFSGTARYSVEVNVPKEDGGEDWLLDLGAVRESARVFVNGAEAGVVFSHPFALRIDGLIQPGKNRLEIEVTNLAANRVIDLDQRRVKWKKFNDANFVNLDYLPFDASGWTPLPSGLLGPVRLVRGE